MDNNSAKQKYLKYKNKYLQLKQMRDQLGLQDAEGSGWGVFSSVTNAVREVSSAVSGYITDSITCNLYYNKESDGKLKHCYNFASQKEMYDMLKDKIMGGIKNISKDSTQIINEPVNTEYTNTLLHELYKANFEIEKMPKLAQLFMKLRLCESNLLELCFDKEYTEYYKGLLDGDILRKMISTNTIDSIKDLLYFNENPIDDINIWDAYSDLLSFIRCIADSKGIQLTIDGLKTAGKIKQDIGTVKGEIVKILKSLKLPVNIVFLEDIFSENRKSLNLQDWYTKTTPTAEQIEAYNNIN